MLLIFDQVATDLRLFYGWIFPVAKKQYLCVVIILISGFTALWEMLAHPL